MNLYSSNIKLELCIELSDVELLCQITEGRISSYCNSKISLHRSEVSSLEFGKQFLR